MFTSSITKEHIFSTLPVSIDVKREATLRTSAELMLPLTPHFTSSTNVVVDSGSPSFFLVNYVNSSRDEHPHQPCGLGASAITLKQNSPPPNKRWTGQRADFCRAWQGQTRYGSCGMGIQCRYRQHFVYFKIE
ncbi:hypothetical protein Zmor_014939 [Zophobas morio]|uniref:Uncharacterized protein n=1 Tax=Zophobas morio TaxID=2755281 RepID=A0AA38ILM9_9CUCU|nr:hypothetical protein Zmor_014939 [Zophobas morio]